MSVQSTTINLCRNVLAVEQKPKGAVNVIIRDIKAGLKVQKKVAQKDFLEACLRMKLFPKDVEAATKLLVRGDIRKVAKEGRKILRNRITDKVREIREARHDWN